MSKKHRTSPPRTTLTVNVGVIGYSDNSAADANRAGNNATAIFSEVQKAVDEIHSSSRALFVKQAPILRVISALASESEILAVEGAMGLKHKYDFQCPLPFSREEYMKGLTVKTKDEIVVMLSKATAVLEMDGTRGKAYEAYLTARLIVLKQSDIVLFIWDGDKEKRKIDGLEEIYVEAMQAGVPVIWLNTNTQDIQWGSKSPMVEWKGALKDQLPKILNPFSRNMKQAGKATLPAHKKYFLEKMKKWNFGFFYKFLVNFILPRKPTINLRIEDFESSTELRWRLDWQTSPGLTRNVTEKIDGTLLHHYAWADNLAIYYANLYRTAFICRYLFGILAILGVAIGFYGSETIQHVGFGVQFVSLLFIIILVKFGNYRGWQERFLDYRFLAELIRHMRYLALMGDTMPSARFPIHNVHEDSTWVNWHFRNIIRELGLINAQLSTDYLKSLQGFLQNCEIKGQIDFYNKNTRDFILVSNRLENVGMWCFYVGMAAILCRVGVYVYGYLSDRLLHSIVTQSKTYFNEISLIIPALAPVLFGIKSQGEFGRLAKRYGAMKTQLMELNQRIENIENLNSTNMRQAAEEAATMMINEVTDWKVLLKARSVSMI